MDPSFSRLWRSVLVFLIERSHERKDVTLLGPVGVYLTLAIYCLENSVKFIRVLIRAGTEIVVTV